MKTQFTPLCGCQTHTSASPPSSRPASAASTASTVPAIKHQHSATKQTWLVSCAIYKSLDVSYFRLYNNAHTHSTHAHVYTHTLDCLYSHTMRLWAVHKPHKTSRRNKKGEKQCVCVYVWQLFMYMSTHTHTRTHMWQSSQSEPFAKLVYVHALYSIYSHTIHIHTYIFIYTYVSSMRSVYPSHVL